MPAPTAPFEVIRHEDELGEYWSACELATLMTYIEWRNFEQVISTAKEACNNSGNGVTDHFVETNKMVTLGSGAQRKVKDYRLTRYACYLIAQNADPSKAIVALAQTYFAVMTRQQEELRELIQQAGDDPLTEIARRIVLRQELTEANKI